MKLKKCNKCGIKKSLESFSKDKRNVGGLVHSCRECINLNSKIHHSKNNKEVNRSCPNCNEQYLVKQSTYNIILKTNRFCYKCAADVRNHKKYGKKKDRIFQTICPRCNKVKNHKWKNQSDHQLKRVIRDLSKKNCKNCSNSINFVYNVKKWNTGPERKFKLIIEQLNIFYIQNYRFIDRNYDFYLPELDILVEIDGTYWHGKNLEFDKLNKTQIKSRINDNYKNKICITNNKKLIRFWEDEITTDNILNKLWP